MLATFGDSLHEQLGRDGDPHRPLTVHFPPPERVSDVALGASHSVAVTTGGKVFCWGDADKLGLPAGRSIGCVATVGRPTRLTPLRSLCVTQVAATATTSFAATTDGSVWTWGSPVGVLPGSPTARPQTPTAPRLLAHMATAVEALACGGLHTLILLRGGAVWAVGDGARGGLGLGDATTTSAVPHQITCTQWQALEERVVGIAAGGGHSVALTADGNVYAWGDNRWGQLGVGDTDDRWSPTRVSHRPGDEKAGDLFDGCARSVCCGDYHTCVVSGEQNVEMPSLLTFGRGQHGQLGHGDFRNQQLPTVVKALVSLRVSSVAAGGGLGHSHTMVLVDSGRRLFGFGSSGAGQLGVDAKSAAVTTIAKDFPEAVRIVAAAGATSGEPKLDAVALPVEIGWWELPPGSRVSRVACGWRHSAIVYDAPAAGVLGSAVAISAVQTSTAAAKPEPEPEHEHEGSRSPDGVTMDSDGWFGLLSDEILIERILLPAVLGTGLKIFDNFAALQPAGVEESWIPMNKMVIVRDLCRLARVSSLWRDITASPLLWAPLFAAHFRDGADSVTPAEAAALAAGCPWKRLFAEAHIQSFLRERSPHGVSQTVWGNQANIAPLLNAAIHEALSAARSSTSTVVQAVGDKAHALARSLRGFQDVRCLWIGLDASGRTTGLYRLVLDDVVTTIPTIGFNVETISRTKYDFTIWDCGGGDRIRPLYRHYYQNTQVLGWWIDSADRARMEESIYWLWETLTAHGRARGILDEQPDLKIVIYANKQDLPGAATPVEMIERLSNPSAAVQVAPHWPHEDGVIPATVGLEALLGPAGERWYVQPCVATTGDGLEDSLEWMSQALVQ